jgi:hypothetical protein
MKKALCAVIIMFFLSGCAGFAFTPPLSEPDKKNAEAAGHSAHDGE